MLWEVILGVFLFFSACFSFVLLVGAPYLPTMKKQVDTALELVGLAPGDTIIELGCGDGRVLIEAAKKGLNAVGYELNPIMFVIGWVRTRRYKRQVKLKLGNFWTATWPKADAVYVFLLPRLMDRLQQKVAAEKAVKPKVVTFAFKFVDLKPVAEKNGVFLYDLSDTRLP